jgi:hypothetical protein
MCRRCKWTIASTLGLIVLAGLPPFKKKKRESVTDSCTTKPLAQSEGKSTPVRSTNSKKKTERNLMRQSCTRCSKLDSVEALANYHGYLFHRVCLVEQIYQHVVSQEKRDELLKPFEITADEVAEATSAKVIKRAYYV